MPNLAAPRRDSGKYTFSVACYMLELYQDDLADLLLPVQPKVGPIYPRNPHLTLSQALPPPPKTPRPARLPACMGGCPARHGISAERGGSSQVAEAAEVSCMKGAPLCMQPAAARAQSGSFGTQVRTPKLEIKKDAKGMVTVPGALSFWPPPFCMPSESISQLRGPMAGA